MSTGRFRHKEVEREAHRSARSTKHLILGNLYSSTMAQSFPYFSSSSSTPPSSSRIPSQASSTPTLPQLPSKRESNLSTSSLSPQTQAQNSVNRQSSLHQQLFQQTQNGGILDRPLNKSKGAEVSMGAWAFMFAEIVSYSQSRVDSVTDLEKRFVLHHQI
jgi:hypothetical protein